MSLYIPQKKGTANIALLIKNKKYFLKLRIRNLFNHNRAVYLYSNLTLKSFYDYS